MMFQTKHEIESWLESNRIRKYHIFPDLSINVHGSVELSSRHLTGHLPVQFNKVNGYFDCRNNKLTSLLGVPRIVQSNFYCVNNLLTSFEYAPRFVGDVFFGTGLKNFTSLHNVHHHLHTIGSALIVPHQIKSHILGLLRVKQISMVSCEYNGPNGPLSIGERGSARAIEIINANLNGKGDIHQAQEQLLDAGLQEFAKI